MKPKYKIAIDCRFWGLEHTGLGRYTMKLVTELTKLDHQNQYYILFRPKYYQILKNKNRLPNTNHPLPNNFKPIKTNIRHYTLKEQIYIPFILHSIKPDILHIPHFNIPIFYKLLYPKTKLIVTIHDLIKHSSVGSQTTTLPMPIYWLKLSAYHLALNQSVKQSSAIIVPSNYVKQQLINKYGNTPMQKPHRVRDTFDNTNMDHTPGVNGFTQKIHVTYEAPDPVYYQKQKHLINIKGLLKKYQLSSPYLIYTGNAYPHKNLSNLIQAINIFNSQPTSPNHQLTLAIVCARNIFRHRVENYVKHLKMQKHIKFLGYVPDSELRELYRNALAFITPSLIEGFGLTGLEAMAAGTPVLAANASCLPEIYHNHAIYFNPRNLQDMVQKIKQALTLKDNKRKQLIKEAQAHSQTFSWTKMAQQTLKVYETI